MVGAGVGSLELLASCGRLPWQAQPAKLARIGFLASFGASFESSPNVEALRNGLRQYGWIEGQNLAIEWRFAEATSPDCQLSRPNWSASRWTLSSHRPDSRRARRGP